MKKKPAARKKKAPARKPAAKKKPAKKKAPVRKKKTTIPRGGARTTPPEPKPEKRLPRQPVPPGNEHAPMREPPSSQEPAIRADDQHGPMHIPSHKPAPAYPELHKNDWAGKPPRNIPIPKR